MSTTVHYLYDPLCGWCYGATTVVSALQARADVTLELLPAGLFLGAGARAMDDTFAGYAWSNDQRIAQLTGQVFSEQYRQRVLGDRQQRFDSGLATLARIDPSRELQVLGAIQKARYVEGGDVTALGTLIGLLESLGLEQAAEQIAAPDAPLLALMQARIDKAQSLLQEFGARGVPTLVAQSSSKRWLLDVGAGYGNPEALLQQLDAGRF
ncbi:DsbA family protein [Xanthomonas hortorum]|uniref:DsbA family protein n=1 Tax=Xanthomonas hortorum TaxID=56454 RepID=UPI0015D5C640|nr:DsbA family protein [Xanthomonas hortorum]MCE4360779.1 DsbA family protein [Xanthomonas hortorum pv. taraxaci]NMI54184.1 DsbA family protein [Xanthomonas hortorum pv. taraxaci]